MVFHFQVVSCTENAGKYRKYALSGTVLLNIKKYIFARFFPNIFSIKIGRKGGEKG